MGLPKEVFYAPKRIWEPGLGDYAYFKVNPRCFEHKTYPTCKHCTQKYVPIEEKDMLCFKCKMTT